MAKQLLSELEENFNSLHSAFENHVRRKPRAIALIWKGQSISYSELDMAASSLASQIANCGVGEGSFVPILLSRSPSLVISLLAVLKTGAAYTLIDSCWPENRIRQVVKVLEPKLIITDNELLSFDGVHVLSPINQGQKIGQSHTSIIVSSLSPSSVFFTSGTTGEPKGVVSTHRGVMRLFKDASFATFNYKTVIPLAAALPWDAFSLELWGALVNGGSAWIIDEPYLSTAALRKGISEYGVNIIWMTSSLFNMIVEEEIDSFSGLKQLMIGGERLSQIHVKNFLNSHPEIKLINGYGPVETTIFATTHQICLRDCDIIGGIPIGIPAPETEVYILTKEMEICNDDEVGQICISGEGLALGYLNDPQLTHHKFKEVIIEGLKKRVYCTGDLGFWKDGLLHFRGRKDRQIKIHGHRIELSEVERQIEQHLKKIKSCKVISRIDRTNSSHELIAFCIPVIPGDLLEGAHKILESKLVYYQCPTKVVAVNSFPLTSQGKLNEQALLEQALKEELVYYQVGEGYKTPIEEAIVKVLNLILNQDFFPADIPFKHLGLNSLDMGRLCSRLGKELHRSIPLSKLYQYPTIASLSEFLNDNRQAVDQQGYAENQSNKLNSMQLIYLTQHLINPSNLASRCLMTWSINGNLNLNSLKNAIVHVHINNKALRSRYLPDFNLDESCDLITSPDLEVLSSQQSKESAINSLRCEFSKDLNPLEGKIWRTAIVPLTQSNTYIFGCAIHHIAFDGYSEHLLAASLSEGYKRSSRGPSIIRNSNNHALINSILIPPNSVTSLSKEAKSFAKTLEGIPEIIWPKSSEKTPNDYNSPTEHIISISRSQIDVIEKISIENGTSCFELLFHAWINALHEVTSQTDFCVGIPIRQRNNFETDNTINCHLNMLCLKITEKVFKSGVLGLQETTRILQKSLASQDIPFLQILQAVKLQKTGRTPLFQVLFALQDNPLPKLDLEGLKTEFIRQPYLDLPLELHTEIWPEEDGSLRFVISRRLECVSRAIVENLIECYKQNLEKIQQFLEVK